MATAEIPEAAPLAADTGSMPVDVEKIRRLRERLGLSQTEAAALAGMKVQHWNRLELGRRVDVTVKTLEKVAAALKVKAKDLLK